MKFLPQIHSDFDPGIKKFGQNRHRIQTHQQEARRFLHDQRLPNVQHENQQAISEVHRARRRRVLRYLEVLLSRRKLTQLIDQSALIKRRKDNKNAEKLICITRRN